MPGVPVPATVTEQGGVTPGLAVGRALDGESLLAPAAHFECILLRRSFASGCGVSCTKQRAARFVVRCARLVASSHRSFASTK